MATAFFVEVLVNGSNLQIDPETLTLLYKDTLEGSAVYMLHAISPDWKKWDQFVTEEIREMKLRWFLVTSTETLYGSWRRVRADRIMFRYFPDAIEVWVSGTDEGIVLGERCHKNNFIDKRVSEMVQTIADQNKLDSRITTTLGTHTLYQCDTPDGQFIRNILLPHAVDNNGEGGFNFYIENGNTLVFEPPNLVKSEQLGEFTILSGVITKDSKNVEVFEVTYNRSIQSYRDHLSLELRGFDIAKKEPAFWVADEDSVSFKKLASVRPPVADLPARVQLTAHVGIGDIPPNVVKEEGVAIWSTDARSLFRTSLTIPPLVDAAVGKTVNVTVRNQEGELHFSTGRWLVYAVLQKRQPGKERAASTTLFLERRTYHK